MILFILSTFVSCKMYDSIPMVDEIGQFEKGSQIKIISDKKSMSKGELIAVTPDRIVFLNRYNKLETINRKNINSVKIIASYTHSKRDAKDADLIGLMTIGHGFWLVFTLPINILTISSNNKSKYILKHSGNINWKSVSMYARFPGGIPEGIDILELEN